MYSYLCLKVEPIHSGLNLRRADVDPAGHDQPQAGGEGRAHGIAGDGEGGLLGPEGDKQRYREV